MRFSDIIYKEYIKFLLFPSIFFFIGYHLKSILNINLDYYLNFSHLSFFLIIITFLLSFLFSKRFKDNIKFEDISLLIISSLVLGVLMAIIQLDLISTRWLSYGRFDINDADDYYSNSSEMIIKNEFYSAKGRIFYPIFYAGLMKLFHFNIFNIQIFISLICCMTIYFTANKIRKNFNYFGSLFYCFLALDFLHENLGGNCTELIGFILGSIAFSLFLEYQFGNKLKYKQFFLFFIAIFLAYLFRPGPPLILIAFFMISYFYFFKKNKWKHNIKVFITPFFALFLIIFLDLILRSFYSPNSPTTFINAIDSWYATIELGKYIKEDKYHQIPSQMWTLIYEHNPRLLNITGDKFTNYKIKIFINRLFSEPSSFLIGSLFLIKQFFIVPFSYWDPHHNTTSFMFVDFLYLRVFLVVFFTIGFISGLFNYLINKDKYNLIIFLIGITIVLSQPFIYGGESRTHATIIGFLWLVIYHGTINILNFYKFVIRKNLDVSGNYNYSINNKESSAFSLLILSAVIFPFLFLILTKKPNYSNIENKYCESNLMKSTILFHSNSGFILTKNLNKKNIIRNYGADHFLDVVINYLTYLNSFGVKIQIPWISEDQILERDKFKFLSKLTFLSTPRSYAMSQKEFNDTFSNIFNFFSKGGGFFIDPIYVNSGEQKNIMVLPFEKIKKGVNILQICHGKNK